MSYTLQYAGSDIDTILGRAAPNGALDAAIAAKQDQLTFDTEPTEGSSNPVTSGGLYEWGKDIASALYITDTASGSIASFSDGADGIPMKSVLCTITPKQAGSGDPSPSNVRAISGYTGLTLTRTGRNIIDGRVRAAQTNAGITSQIYADNRMTASGTPTGNGDAYFNFNRYLFLPSGTSITVSWDGTLTRTGAFNLFLYTGSAWPQYKAVPASATSATITLTADRTLSGLMFRFNANTGTVTMDARVQVEIGTSASAYESYAGESIAKDWTSEAGTVYGGTLDVVSGKLKTAPYYSSYAGETLVGPWVSSMDVYAEGTTPTTGAQVVDLGDVAQTYQLTPQQVTSLLGENNVWNTAGDTEAAYVADPKLYIAKMIGGTASTASTLSMSRPSLTLAGSEPEVDALADVAEPEAIDEAETGEEA